MRQRSQWAGSRGGGGRGQSGSTLGGQYRLHTRKAVRHVRPAFACFAEQQADDAFPRVLGNSIVVIDDAEEHQWVNDHLVWRCHQAGKRFAISTYSPLQTACDALDVGLLLFLEL